MKPELIVFFFQFFCPLKFVNVPKLGIAHEDAGEVPRAYVVAKNGAKPEDILNFVNGRHFSMEN